MENVLSREEAQTRSILKNVYFWMTGGLIVTALTSLWLGTQAELVNAFYSNSLLHWGSIILEFVLVIALSAAIGKMSAPMAALCFLFYAFLNGLNLGWIFQAYTAISLTRVFFITAGTFAVMSIWGMTTKFRLDKIGNYLFMALIGIVIASLVNFFLKSHVFYYVISFAGVVVFCGLTAWNTQKIKRMSDQMSGEVSELNYFRLSILGALMLYLDFINLFLFFLRIFGGRRN